MEMSNSSDKYAYLYPFVHNNLRGFLLIITKRVF